MWQYASIANSKHPEAAIEDGSAQQAWGNALSNLSTLKAAAKAARICVSTAVQDGQGGDRYGEDTPLDEIMLELAVLYFEVTGKKPEISTHFASRKPSGPFLSFLGLCLEELGYPLEPDAIRSRFRRLRERYPDDPIIAGSGNIT